MSRESTPSNLLRSSVDGYGFNKGENFDHESYDEFMSRYISVLARRASRWQALIGHKTRVSKSRKVKRYCRKGIPSEYRAMIWMSITGAEARIRANPNTYRNILLSQRDEHLSEPITMDLHRTFPDNIYFTGTEGFRKPLNNVLVALAHKNIERGYCQGMNFVAGMLLIVLKDEEKAFWLMDTLINGILPDFYAPDMRSVKAEQELLGEIIRWKAPELHAHLESIGVQWFLIGTKWFLCLFADVMPVETVLRIWDCLFYEGPKILLRVAATLILQNSSKLQACKNFSQAMDAFKEVTTSASCIDCHEFMKKCFDELGPFPSAKISKMREECLKKIY
ncbi:hypothetical protein FSP39_019638 [Pinctada imbricata]|uniref:Growth hormone-regulated TBC protein 1 n=1 Tax=Pinctada imbricata TaxID=66713 RepID=A0AA89BTZ9_PINIB|nr:hypothetical protein FSP39_019638 [Pinctada imbricata]